MFSIWHVLSVFENTEIQRNPTMTLDKQALTERQRRLIPFLLTSRSTEEACRRARINKSTVYEWMKDEAFRNELKVMEPVMRRGFGSAACKREIGRSPSLLSRIKILVPSRLLPIRHALLASRK
jgi:hypothetical protein